MYKVLFFLILSSPLWASWDDYHHQTEHAAKPWGTVVLAQQYFDQENRAPSLAIDLGSGTGRDTLFLLNKGWRVLAIDGSPLAIEILNQRVEPQHIPFLQTSVSPFSEIILTEQADLINASYSLPFCPPEDFPSCWHTIVEHLAPGGRFASHFFGDHDEWAADPTLTCLSQEELLSLLEEDFEIEYLHVEEGPGPTAAGPPKHWHVFHVVAKKRGQP